MSNSIIGDYDPAVFDGKDRVVAFKADPICRVRLRSGHIMNEGKIIRANPQLAKYIKHMKRWYAGFCGEVTIDFMIPEKGRPEIASASFYVPGRNGKDGRFWVAWSKELEYICFNLGLERANPVAEGRIKREQIEAMAGPVILMSQTKYYLKD